MPPRCQGCDPLLRPRKPGERALEQALRRPFHDGLPGRKPSLQVAIDAVRGLPQRPVGNDQRDEDQHIHERRPQVARADGVGAAKAFRGRPDQQAEEASADIDPLPGQAQEKSRGDQRFNEAGEPDEDPGGRRHDRDPERKPGARPIRLAVSRIVEVSNVMRRERRLPRQVGINRPDHTEDRPDCAGDHDQPGGSVPVL